MDIVETNIWEDLVVDLINEMKRVSEEKNFTAKQKVNGVTVYVRADTVVEHIMRDLHRAQSGCIAGEVGPYPKATLSDAELERDNAVREKNRAQREEEEEQNKKAFETELAQCPQMERDEEKWQKGIQAAKDDERDLACYEFAEYWARLMQKGMLEGKKMSEIADDCSSRANTTVGISGSMYRRAASILVNYWTYGEELGIWHETEKTNWSIVR